jgi:glutathione S-transferase
LSLKFYYSPMSTSSLTELVLEELAVPCEKIKLDIQKGDTKKPEFLAINPNGKVPAVVHDGTALWESAALTIYLGEVFGVEKKLWPAPGKRRGEAIKWVVWTNATLYEAVSRFTRNTQDWFPADQRNAKAGEAAKADVANCLRILDEALEGKQYLVGDYSLADTHLHSITDWLRHLKLDFTPYSRINAWGQRCSSRPAYAKIMSAGA